MSPMLTPGRPACAELTRPLRGLTTRAHLHWPLRSALLLGLPLPHISAEPRRTAAFTQAETIRFPSL